MGEGKINLLIYVMNESLYESIESYDPNKFIRNKLLKKWKLIMSIIFCKLDYVQSSCVKHDSSVQFCNVIYPEF